MAVKAVFFDLDGTLLPMELSVFGASYFKLAAESLATIGLTYEESRAMIWDGYNTMLHNDGSRTNEQAFFERVRARYDEKRAVEIKVCMNAFHRGAFRGTALTCFYDPRARIAVETAKKRGFRTVLATNPVFPAVATEIRMGFAGLTPRDFCLYTTYENSRFCKPNPRYFEEVAKKLSLDLSDCVMVGNDTHDDLPATALGMPVFMVDTYLVDPENKDISSVPHGDLGQLIDWIGSL